MIRKMQDALRVGLAGVVLLLLGGCLFSPGAQSQHMARYFDDPKAQALAAAAERNDVQEVKRLMTQEHVNPDIYFSKVDGFPLLAWPILTESPAGLKALLDNGADPNARNPHRVLRRYSDGGVSNHLFYFGAVNYATRVRDPQYLELLLEHGGNPNTPTTSTESLLYHAKLYGSWRHVQLLVEHGADPKGSAVAARSILGLYTDFANFEQVYWLLQHGADPMDKADQNPILPPPHSQVVDDIYWYPSATAEVREWQRLCQLWLMDHGIPRPEKMGDVVRETRRTFHDPDREEDIPLPTRSPTEAKD